MKLILLFTFICLGYAKFNKDDCVCKLGGTSGRMVGGLRAEMNSIPWQVSLADEDGKHFCGAVIINKNNLLTSANCVDGKKTDQIKARLGLHILDDREIESKTYSIKKMFYNEFRGRGGGGDIAILELSKPINFSRDVEPACLNLDSNEDYDELMASGWGSTDVPISENGNFKIGKFSQILKSAYFYEDKSDCEDSWICVDSHNGESICNGDNGGPLHHTGKDKKGKTTVEGIASFATNEKRPKGITRKLCNGEGIFTRLYSYKHYIENIIGDDYCTIKKSKSKIFGIF